MNISTIQVISNLDGMTHIWRCRPGVGQYQNVLVVTGEVHELSYLAKGMTFALLGRKDPQISEVTLELDDNAGDTWSIQRGPFGSRFNHNGRNISVDQAQKSMLAALLDMDVSLAQGEGLTASLVFRTIEYKSGVFTGRDGLNQEPSQGRSLDADLVMGLLAEECARLTGKAEYARPERLANIAETLMSLQGKWAEAQSLPLTQASGKAAAPSLSMIETLSRELDHLLQIDFLCKKMGDGQESPARLSGQIEALDHVVSGIRERWTDEQLTLGSDLEQWGKGLELLVRVRGYAKLSETAARIRRICVERVRPIAETALGSWDTFLNGSRATGQEIESCLASMLLGMKQLGADLEKIMPIPTQDPVPPPESSAGWFERLRGTSARSEKVPAVSDAARLHQKWLASAMHEVEAIKESLDYSLKAVQTFVDDTTASKAQANRGMQLLEELAQKSGDELARLATEWKTWASTANLSDDIAIDLFCALAQDSARYRCVTMQRESLVQRFDERLAMQASLEALIRQWWTIIGSDKGVDITNPAFLVAEARAALRHRDTRRQRVQKIVKDAAKQARDESLLQWAHKRKSELQAQWLEAFQSAGLPPLEITDPRIATLARLASAVQATRQFQTLKDEAVVLQTDLWAVGANAAVRVYSLQEKGLGDEARSKFVELALGAQTSRDTSLNVFLVPDLILAEQLLARGFGGGIRLPRQASFAPETLPVLPTEPLQSPSRRSGGRGARSRDESKDMVAPPPGLSTADTAGNLKKVKPAMSPKAEAALNLLNPRARK